MTRLLRPAAVVAFVALIFLLSGLYSILFDLPHEVAIAVLVLGVAIYVGKAIIG